MNISHFHQSAKCCMFYLEFHTGSVNKAYGMTVL